MKRVLSLIALAFGAVLSAHASESYTMDTLHSIPTFEFSHLGMTTQTGRFDKAAGTVTLDRVAHKGRVHYEVDATSMNMGFGTETPESPGYHLFEVTKFLTIVFTSDELFFDDNDNVVAAAGHLTLLGVTKPINIWVSDFKCSINPMNKKHMCAANITANIRRSEFGMMRFIPAISDEVTISVPVEAYKD